MEPGRRVALHHRLVRVLIVALVQTIVPDAAVTASKIETSRLGTKVGHMRTLLRAGTT